MLFIYTVNMAKKRHYPPAFYRYLEKHKNVSVMFTLEDYKKLEAMALTSNKKITEFIRSVIFNFKDELNNVIEKVYIIGYNDAINGRKPRYNYEGVVENGEEEER